MWDGKSVEFISWGLRPCCMYCSNCTYTVKYGLCKFNCNSSYVILLRSMYAIIHLSNNIKHRYACNIFDIIILYNNYIPRYNDSPPPHFLGYDNTKKAHNNTINYLPSLFQDLGQQRSLSIDQSEFLEDTQVNDPLLSLKLSNSLFLFFFFLSFGEKMYWQDLHLTSWL